MHGVRRVEPVRLSDAVAEASHAGREDVLVLPELHRATEHRQARPHGDDDVAVGRGEAPLDRVLQELRLGEATDEEDVLDGVRSDQAGDVRADRVEHGLEEAAHHLGREDDRRAAAHLESGVVGAVVRVHQVVQLHLVDEDLQHRRHVESPRGVRAVGRELELLPGLLHVDPERRRLVGDEVLPADQGLHEVLELLVDVRRAPRPTGGCRDLVEAQRARTLERVHRDVDGAAARVEHHEALARVGLLVHVAGDGGRLRLKRQDELGRLESLDHARLERSLAHEALRTVHPDRRNREHPLHVLRVHTAGHGAAALP
mmetsp:Transcript_23883/g.60711  ORF Transcript_23883/g.60711 Transcript_23883/m.60711 type:complete len:315 (-) Transcript_23883:174-1118(-)